MASTPITPRENPVTRAKVITPHDSTNIVLAAGSQKGYPRAFMVNTTGNVVIVMAGIQTGDDATVTLAVTAGVMYPISVKRFNTTNHTAGVVTAFW